MFAWFKRIISRQYIYSHKKEAMGPFSERMLSITIDLERSPKPSTTRTTKIPLNQFNRWMHTNVCSGIKIKSVKNHQSYKINSTHDDVSLEPIIESGSLGPVDKKMSMEADKKHIEVASPGNQNRRQKSNSLKVNNNEQLKNGNDQEKNSKRNQRRARRKSNKNQ